MSRKMAYSEWKLMYCLLCVSLLSVSVILLAKQLLWILILVSSYPHSIGTALILDILGKRSQTDIMIKYIPAIDIFSDVLQGFRARIPRANYLSHYGVSHIVFSPRTIKEALLPQNGIVYSLFLLGSGFCWATLIPIGLTHYSSEDWSLGIFTQQIRISYDFSRSHSKISHREQSV